MRVRLLPASASPGPLPSPLHTSGLLWRQAGPHKTWAVVLQAPVALLPPVLCSSTQGIHRTFGRWRCAALMHVTGAMCAPALPKCSLPLCSTRCQPGLVLPLVVTVSPARLGAACAGPVGNSIRGGSVGSWDHPEVCGLALKISCLGPWGWGHQASPLWSPLVSSPLNPVSGPCLALGAPGNSSPCGAANGPGPDPPPGSAGLIAADVFPDLGRKEPLPLGCTAGAAPRPAQRIAQDRFSH